MTRKSALHIEPSLLGELGAPVLGRRLSIHPHGFAMATGHGGQRITAQKIIGAGLGLAGMLVTIGVESLRDFNTAAPLAQAAVLGASLCYALAPMWDSASVPFLQRLPRRER
jgi:hypothetical protein